VQLPEMNKNKRFSYKKNLTQFFENHSQELQVTKTLVAMLDDKNNKATSFLNGHPTWQR